MPYNPENYYRIQDVDFGGWDFSPRPIICHPEAAEDIARILGVESPTDLPEQSNSRTVTGQQQAALSVSSLGSQLSNAHNSLSSCLGAVSTSLGQLGNSSLYQNSYRWDDAPTLSSYIPSVPRLKPYGESKTRTVNSVKFTREFMWTNERVSGVPEIRFTPRPEGGIDFSEMYFPVYRCPNCQKIFITDSNEGLKHGCTERNSSNAPDLP